MAKPGLRSDTRHLVDLGSPSAESFRALRLALELRSEANGDARIILITSAEPAEGKSTIAANYALATADPWAAPARSVTRRNQTAGKFDAGCAQAV